MTDPQLDIARLGGTTMGTTWSVSLVAPRQRDLHPLHAGIQARLDEVVAQMSTWEPGSDLSRYNRANAGQWCVLPAETRQVLACAQAIAAASDGAFDPTVGPLVALWGFGAHAGERRQPNDATLQATRDRCGWQHLQWQDDALLQPGGLELDLSAIAKGFGVDHVAAWLRDQGIAAALIEVGGELAGYGRKPDGHPGAYWWNPHRKKTRTPKHHRGCWRWRTRRWPPPVIAGTSTRPMARLTVTAWTRALADRCARLQRQ